MKYYLKNIRYFRKKILYSFLLLLLIILLIFVIPYFINIAFRIPSVFSVDWNVNDALSYYGTILGSIATIIAIIITINNERKSLLKEKELSVTPILETSPYNIPNGNMPNNINLPFVYTKITLNEISAKNDHESINIYCDYMDKFPDIPDINVGYKNIGLASALSVNINLYVLYKINDNELGEYLNYDIFDFYDELLFNSFRKPDLHDCRKKQHITPPLNISNTGVQNAIFLKFCISKLQYFLFEYEYYSLFNKKYYQYFLLEIDKSNYKKIYPMSKLYNSPIKITFFYSY